MPLVEIKPVGRGNHHGLRLPGPPDGVIDNILLQHIVIAERLLPGYEYMNTCEMNHSEEGNPELLEIGTIAEASGSYGYDFAARLQQTSGKPHEGSIKVRHLKTGCMEPFAHGSLGIDLLVGRVKNDMRVSCAGNGKKRIARF